MKQNSSMPSQLRFTRFNLTINLYSKFKKHGNLLKRESCTSYYYHIEDTLKMVEAYLLGTGSVEK